MTIRKRYDEARRLMALGEWEASLVIALVATAGAASNRSKRLGEDKGDKQKFVEYIRGLVSIHFTGIGKDISGEEILYKYLRCELIHDGTTENFGWLYTCVTLSH